MDEKFLNNELLFNDDDRITTEKTLCEKFTHFL